MKKIKIFDSDGCTPKFEKRINYYLNKGWKIKGNIFQGNSGLVVTMYK